jgi:hypothetical protein
MGYSNLMPVLEYLHEIGTVLVEDDINDYGQFDRFHHWLLGELIRTFSLLGGLAVVLSEVSK